MLSKKSLISLVCAFSMLLGSPGYAAPATPESNAGISTENADISEFENTVADTMIHKDEKRTSFDAKFISAPREYLKSLQSFPETTLNMGNWINSWFSRGHFRRDFTAKDGIRSAYIEYQSDNPFDFFINGTQIPTVKTADGMHIIKYTDIMEYIKPGTNNLAIRYYTGDNALKAVGAIRGNIMINYSDGSAQQIPTDSSWKNGAVCGFWRQTEPNGWQTSAIPSTYVSVNSLEMHPSLLRRSCYFRKTFDLSKEIKSAYLYACARGSYVPYINGLRITDGRFLAGSMRGYTEYQIYDVSALLENGSNALCAYTGNGQFNCSSWGTLRYNVPAVMMQLEIEYTDGTKQNICTDTSWDVTASPLYDNDLQFGERYDARLEIDGWNTTGKVGGTWVNAAQANVGTLKPFASTTYPAVKIRDESEALSIGTVLGGEYKLYDFGTNSAGRAKIMLKNTKPGEVVIIRYCEIIDDDVPRTDVYGDVYFQRDNYADSISPYGLRNIDVYICKGAEEEVYMPEFAYTGFRYVYIKGYSGEYTTETVKKEELNTNLAVIGDFTSSSENLNKIWDAVKRSYRSNIVTGPTDCPTREKNFWNGDIADFAATACWYMDNDAFLSRWTEAGEKLQYDVYGWEDEEYILPLTLYKYYGNRDVLETKYPVIQGLIAKRKSQLADGSVLPSDHSPYNDHQATSNVPADFFAAAYYCRMYRDAAEIADILGKESDKAEYTKKFQEAKDAFNEKYYLSESNTYTPKNQSGIILPLAFGIADSENVQALTDTLDSYIRSSNYTLTCGFSSMEFVLGLLCDGGYENDAWKVINCTEFPSLLNMINSYGGGTTTESWRSAASIVDSMNHYAIGGITRWFFEYLGGLRIVKADFEEIDISPVFYSELGDCSVYHDSSRGRITTAWKYNADSKNFTWNVTVPDGVSANLKLSDEMSFYDNGKELSDKTITVTGGTYSYTVADASEPVFDLNDKTALGDFPYVKDGFGKVMVYANGRSLSEYTYADPDVSVADIQISENGSRGELAKDPVTLKKNVTWVRSSGWEMYKPHFKEFILHDGKYYMTAQYLIPTGSTVGDSKTFIGKPCFNNGKDYADKGNTLTPDYFNSNKNVWITYMSSPIEVDGDNVSYCGQSIPSNNLIKNYMALNIKEADSGMYVKNYAIYYYPANSFILKDENGLTLVENSSEDYTFPEGNGEYLCGENVYAPGQQVKVSELEYKTVEYKATARVNITFDDGTATEMLRLFPGNSITKQAQKENNDFIGWSLSKDKIQFTTVVPDTSCTLYAVFSPKVSHDKSVLGDFPYVKDGLGKVMSYASGSSLKEFTYLDESVGDGNIQISENGSYAELASDPAGTSKTVTWVRSSGWEMYKPHYTNFALQNGKYFMCADYLIPSASNVTNSTLFIGKPCFDNGKDYSDSGNMLTPAYFNANKGKWINYVSSPILVNSDIVSYCGTEISSRNLIKNYMAMNIDSEKSGMYVKDYAIYYYPAGAFILDDGGALSLIETDGTSYTFPGNGCLYTADGKTYSSGQTVSVSEIEYKTLKVVNAVSAVYSDGKTEISANVSLNEKCTLIAAVYSDDGRMTGIKLCEFDPQDGGSVAFSVSSPTKPGIAKVFACKSIDLLQPLFDVPYICTVE